MSKMPVLFVGHGSPMNAVEENEYSRAWKEIGKMLPKPKAIIAISAHWFTRGTKIMNEENPKTIYDMYGFPPELYQVNYNIHGDSELAKLVSKLITKENNFDNSWGIDHGTWSVLVHMFPNRDVPVFQISIDAFASPEQHYKIGQELAILREQGVLLFATGNIVHNLRLVDWHQKNKGFDWAYEFDDFINKNITDYNYQEILKYNDQGAIARLSVPTPDHFSPLLYALGATSKEDIVKVFNKSCELGSLTMTSYLWE